MSDSGLKRISVDDEQIYLDIRALPEGFFFAATNRLPPSINKTYKSSNGGFHMSPEARLWKEWFGGNCYWTHRSNAYWTDPPLLCSCWFIGSNYDADNRLKILGDALQMGRLVENDKLIESHVVRKCIVRQRKKMGLVLFGGPESYFDSVPLMKDEIASCSDFPTFKEIASASLSLLDLLKAGGKSAA